MYSPVCRHVHVGHNLPDVVRLYGPLQSTIHFTVSGHASATEGIDSVVRILGCDEAASAKTSTYFDYKSYHTCKPHQMNNCMCDKCTNIMAMIFGYLSHN